MSWRLHSLRAFLPIAVFVSGGLLAGCAVFTKPSPRISGIRHDYYVRKVCQIDLTDPAHAEPPAIPLSDFANSDLPLDQRQPVYLTLHRGIQFALGHNHIIRRNVQFLFTDNPLLDNPELTASILDPAIQNSNIGLANRGVQAALSDFAPQLSSRMLWGRDERVQNNLFLGGLPPGTTLADETGVFTLRLEKPLATGGSVAVNHDVDYSGANIPTRLFLSEYSGDLQFEFTQPLLAGAGTEFTQIAGPGSTLFPRQPLVNQGVLIAQINDDVARLEFLDNVQRLVKDVSDVYWDLYSLHRTYAAEVAARDDALKIWQKEQAEFEAGRGTAAREAEAADFYYQLRGRAEDSLAVLNETEIRLRRLLYLPSDDGTYLLPIDEPDVRMQQPSWRAAVHHAILRRVELQKTKWNIRNLQLQLKAARSLVRPQLNFVARYRVNGFGDQLISGSDNDGRTNQGFRSYYDTLSQGSQTGWNLGIVASAPLGFRLAQSQVQNLELRLAKLRAALAAQEHEIALELSNTFNSLKRWRELSGNNAARREASQRRVNALDAVYEAGRTPLDDLLRARESHTQAEIQYNRVRAEYMKAVNELQFRQGALLETFQVFVADPACAALPGDCLQSARGEHVPTSDAHLPLSVPDGIGFVQK